MAEKLAAGTIKAFAEGETILRENAHIHSIPIVLDGAVKVIRSDDDGRTPPLLYIAGRKLHHVVPRRDAPLHVQSEGRGRGKKSEILLMAY